MKNLYLLILDDPRGQNELPPDVIAHFKAIIRDYNARFDIEQVKPFTKDLDDKRLFTRSFVADICCRNGCRLVEIRNKEQALVRAFTDQLLENLKLSGLEHHRLPNWVLEICGEFDEHLDVSLKRRLVLEGAYGLSPSRHRTGKRRRPRDLRRFFEAQRRNCSCCFDE
jgi:hypothetical protein